MADRFAQRARQRSGSIHGFIAESGNGNIAEFSGVLIRDPPRDGLRDGRRLSPPG